MANTYNIPTIENDTFAEKLNNVSEKLDNMTLMLAAIADSFSETADGNGLYFRNPKALQMLNRMGLASKVLDDYSYIIINKESEITIAAHGSGLTGATVDEDKFVSEIGTAETKEYEFIFDGSAWHLDGHSVMLSVYGISITGTPAEGDTITVDETAEAMRYDVLGIDHDIPSDPNFTHTITLCSHDCKAYNGLEYKKPQGLIYVDPDIFPNGLTAGATYYIIGDHCCYDNTTKEDGSYGFTPNRNVPAGGLVRHTALGGLQSSASAYNKEHILAGTFSTYDTVANGRAVIETGLVTTETSSGTLLGTVTAESPSYRSADYLNFTRRNAYGSNAWAGSDERAWMNSDAKKGTDANGDMLWHAGYLGKFDLPATYNAPGNLHGFDPQMLGVIGEVRKRTYVMPADRADQAVKYVDTDEKFFSLSMLEANLETTSDGVYENAVDRDGNVKTAPYPYYQRRATAAERIKYQNGTARHWFLRSPYPSYCNNVRSCSSSGSLSSYYANHTYGAVDAYNIV